MIKFLILLSRQGIVRLSKWYETYSRVEKGVILRDSIKFGVNRSFRLCSFLEYKENTTLIFRRYASMTFVAGIDRDDNPLLILSTFQLLVRALDDSFKNVCELSLIFNFPKAYMILDEIIAAGHLEESDVPTITRNIRNMTDLIEGHKKVKSTEI